MEEERRTNEESDWATTEIVEVFNESKKGNCLSCCSLKFVGPRDRPIVEF